MNLLNYYSNIIFSILLYYFIFNLNSNVNCVQWNYKYSQTSLSLPQQQLTINCLNNDQIWIGWSHYGTRLAIDTTIQQNELSSSQQQQIDFQSMNIILNENDCWMNFTEKISEQCNGASECDISSQPTYIHKCGKISDYIFVSYVCYKVDNTYDICKDVNVENTELLITSPDFPNEYSPSIDCTCSITSNNNFKFDVLWFSLQDNDFLSILNYKNLSGWLNPTNELIMQNKTTTIRFKTDDALAYKGFWLKVGSSKACKDDWQLVGDNCIKVFSESLDWRSANQKCQSMNGYLVKIDDVLNDLKLTQYMKINYPDISSYWIGLRKYVDETNKEKWMWSDFNSTLYNDVSWWPWRRNNLNDNSNNNNNNNNNNKQINQNCIIKRRNEDGYFTVSCDAPNRNSFICQTDNSIVNLNTKISLKCDETEKMNKKLFSTLASNTIASTTTISQKISKFNIPIDINNIITTLKNSDSLSSKDKVSILLPIDDHDSSSNVIYDEFNRNQQLLTTILKSQFDIVSSSTNKIETKYNTTVIAGIISGVGLVILIVNVLVLVICRRNLKKLIKNAKQQSQQPNSNNNDDVTQEYFESFTQTLPPSYNHQQQNNNISTIKPVLIRKDDLLKNLTLKSTISKQQQQQQQLNCLFQPLSNDLVDSSQQSQLQQQQQVHQYDKMNHQFKSIKSDVNNDNNLNSNSQHFYESVETLELPFNTNKRNIHLGVSSCNFKINNNLINSQNLLFNSINNTSNNVNDLCFNTTSTSSSSTTSSASSTNQFLKQFTNKNQLKQQSFKNGSWSPDSAYYSSIPNYGYNTLAQQQQQQLQQQTHLRQPFNFNFINNEHILNENFKSQFV